jgi:hypothetical protein
MCSRRVSCNLPGLPKEAGRRAGELDFRGPLMTPLLFSAITLSAARSSAGRGFGAAPSNPSTPASKRPNISKRNQQKLEALLLRTLHVQDVWVRMSGAVGSFGATTRAVELAPSSTHGVGLFAREALEEDVVASFYPVHALGSADACLCTGEENEAHFAGEDGPSGYRVNPSHRSLEGWANDCWIDANPNLPDQPGWLAHRANDAARCTAATEDTILEYYAQCAERANAILVPFGDAAPIMCLWTIRPIAAGEEIVQIYGHDYWIKLAGGVVPPYTESVLRAARRSWKDRMRAVVTDRLPDLMCEEVALLEGIMTQ